MRNKWLFGVAILVAVMATSMVANATQRYSCKAERAQECGEEEPTLDLNPCPMCIIAFCMSAQTVDNGFAVEYNMCDSDHARCWDSCLMGGTLAYDLECTADCDLRWDRCYQQVRERHRKDCVPHLNTLSECLVQNNCNQF